MIQTPSLPLPLESSQSFCRRQTDTVGMAPLAHAEGYLGPPEGYPTDGHSLPLAPRGEVGTDKVQRVSTGGVAKNPSGAAGMEVQAIPTTPADHPEDHLQSRPT